VGGVWVKAVRLGDSEKTWSKTDKSRTLIFFQWKYLHYTLIFTILQGDLARCFQFGIIKSAGQLLQFNKRWLFLESMVLRYLFVFSISKTQFFVSLVANMKLFMSVPDWWENELSSAQAFVLENPRIVRLVPWSSLSDTKSSQNVDSGLVSTAVMPPRIRVLASSRFSLRLNWIWNKSGSFSLLDACFRDELQVSTKGSAEASKMRLRRSWNSPFVG
jgi:hypothetical protein